MSGNAARNPVFPSPRFLNLYDNSSQFFPYIFFLQWNTTLFTWVVLIRIACNCVETENLWPLDSRSHWDLEVLAFSIGRDAISLLITEKPENLEKTLEARMRTNNKLDRPENKPRPHWWKWVLLPLYHLCTPKLCNFTQSLKLPEFLNYLGNWESTINRTFS